MTDEVTQKQTTKPQRWQFAQNKHLFALISGIAVVSLIGNVLIYSHFTTLRPLVSVGKTAITKRQYQASLEEAAGKEVLNKLVFTALVRQAATQAGVMPTDREVTARITEERTRNPALYDSLSDSQLRDDVTSLLALENLRMQNVTVTEGEIAYYYVMHGSALLPAPQMKAALIVTANPADAKAGAHMLQENIEPAIIAEQPGFHVVGINNFSLDMRKPGRQGIVRTVLHMKRGQIRIFRLGKQFMTVEVYTNPASVPPLWKVKARVARLARLAKAPTAAAELASLYHSNKPTFEIDKYAAYFEDIDRLAPKSPQVVP